MNQIPDYAIVPEYWNGRENIGWKYCETREHVINVDEYGQTTDTLRVPAYFTPEEIIRLHLQTHPWGYPSKLTQSIRRVA